MYSTHSSLGYTTVGNTEPSDRDASDSCMLVRSDPRLIEFVAEITEIQAGCLKTVGDLKRRAAAALWCCIWSFLLLTFLVAAATVFSVYMWNSWQPLLLQPTAAGVAVLFFAVYVDTRLHLADTRTKAREKLDVELRAYLCETDEGPLRWISTSRTNDTHTIQLKLDGYPVLITTVVSDESVSVTVRSE
jgi:hypothetical protein